MAPNQNHVNSVATSTQPRATSAMSPGQKHTNFATKPDKRSGFLDLPPEIRNAIYRLTLTHHLKVRILHDHLNLWPNRCKVFSMPLWNDPASYEKYSRSDVTEINAGRLQVNLLRTCRQVHDEATSFLYGSNCFEFYELTGVRGLNAFLSFIGDSRRHLRHIQILHEHRNKSLYKQAVSQLKHAKKLQKLEICRHGLSLEEHVTALRVLMQALHKARGSVGRTGFVVDIVEFVAHPQGPRSTVKDSAMDTQMTQDVRRELQKLRKEDSRAENGLLA